MPSLASQYNGGSHRSTPLRHSVFGEIHQTMHVSCLFFFAFCLFTDFFQLCLDPCLPRQEHCPTVEWRSDPMISPGRLPALLTHPDPPNIPHSDRMDLSHRFGRNLMGTTTKWKQLIYCLTRCQTIPNVLVSYGAGARWQFNVAAEQINWKPHWLCVEHASFTP